VHWEKLAIPPALRSALLTLAAIACLSLAAFLISRIVGFAALGVLLFVLEFLSRPAQPNGRRT
jgi:hypothetical protein